MSERVLSIQSHVVHGTVGNKAAVFPLQLLGYDVDFINTVQFSNHTGFPSFRGQKLDAQQILELVDGIVANNLHCSIKYLLSGYVGSAESVRTLVTIRERLLSVRPNILYLCDPVLGDDGKLYLSAEHCDIYRQHVLPVADIVTPNGFEAATLSGVPITGLKDVIAAARWFHEVPGVPVVFVTSAAVQTDSLPPRPPLPLGCSGMADPEQSTGETIIAFLSVLGHPPIFFRIPWVTGFHFTGTGDFSAAVFLGWYGRLVPSHATYGPRAMVAAGLPLQYADILAAAQNTLSSAIHIVHNSSVAACADGAPPKFLDLDIVANRKLIEASTTVVVPEYCCTENS